MRRKKKPIRYTKKHVQLCFPLPNFKLSGSKKNESVDFITQPYKHKSTSARLESGQSFLAKKKRVEKKKNTSTDPLPPIYETVDDITILLVVVDGFYTINCYGQFFLVEKMFPGSWRMSGFERPQITPFLTCHQLRYLQMLKVYKQQLKSNIILIANAHTLLWRFVTLNILNDSINNNSLKMNKLSCSFGTHIGCQLRCLCLYLVYKSKRK